MPRIYINVININTVNFHSVIVPGQRRVDQYVTNKTGIRCVGFLVNPCNFSSVCLLVEFRR
jgi:hypothetical protein